MRVLVACESSGVVRDAFRNRGHDAWSCDLQEADDGSEWHIKGDAVNALCDAWDLVIAHPPCTYLCSSGLHWNGRIAGRDALTEAGARFFLLFTRLCCKWAIENPIGCMSKRFRKPDQIIQPWQFGHDASKATCLWLHGLPKLMPTKYVEPRIVSGKKRWANQTDSGQNNAAGGKLRWKVRSKTYEGIAEAMADQWGTL